MQQKLLEALHATGKPVVLVLTTGSALAVRWAQEKLPAIVLAWYPGQQGGNAVADVLFGDASPGGPAAGDVLPVGRPDLPPFDDYAMEGRTYRYFRGEPLYPFGHGLSYTRFAYSGLKLSRPRAGASDTVEVARRREEHRAARRRRGRAALRARRRGEAAGGRTASCAASSAST